MITYAFEQRLVPLIQAGLVCQTFRGPSLRHARPGERIRLTDRQHFRAIVDDPVCVAVERCEVVWQLGRIHTIREGGAPLVNHARFARGLGYTSVEEMEEDLSRSFAPDYIEGFLVTWSVPTAQGQSGVAA